MYFIICSGILGLFGTTLIWGFNCSQTNEDSWEKLAVISFVGILLTVVFCFILVPLLSSGYEEIYYSNNFKWLRSPTAIYVEYPNQLGNTVRLGPYTDVDTWNNIQNMHLKVTKSWDYYGLKNQSNVELVK